MRSSRLAAAAIAAGSMVLGMAGPALATPVKAEPKAGQFCKKAELKVHKRVQLADGTLLECKLMGSQELPHWVKISPAKPPEFKFDASKVKLSSRRVAPGLKTVFKVICPTTVTITGNGYTRDPLPVKKIGKNTWTAVGTFRSHVPDPAIVTIVCKGYGSVRYSNSPETGGNGMKPKQPKIPVGRIDTGDGSMYGRTGGSPAPFLAAGWGALMAAGLGAVALRRRAVRERP